MILFINVKLTARMFIVISTLLYYSYKEKMDELMNKSKKEVKKVFSIRLSESQIEHLELKAKMGERKFQLSTEMSILINDDIRLLEKIIEEEPKYQEILKLHEALELHKVLKSSGLKIVKIQGKEDEK